MKNLECKFLYKIFFSILVFFLRWIFMVHVPYGPYHFVVDCNKVARSGVCALRQSLRGRLRMTSPCQVKLTHYHHCCGRAIIDCSCSSVGSHAGSDGARASQRNPLPIPQSDSDAPTQAQTTIPTLPSPPLLYVPRSRTDACHWCRRTRASVGVAACGGLFFHPQIFTQAYPAAPSPGSDDP
jgi:hypothetical protein